ncbi:MAG: MarR family winged helix-turn-helix transcriptional regulator [Phycisphaerae bacterium]
MAEEIFELNKLSWVARPRGGGRRGSDLSESEFLALDLLVRHQPMSVGQLQRAIGVLPAQMSRVIRSLESKADKPLIRCSINPRDRRRIDVVLTEAGQKAHQSYRAVRLARAVEVLAELSESDRREFMRILRTVRLLLDKRRAGGGLEARPTARDK